jgi:flagellar biosynthesis chaperone FliJ
MGRDPMRMLRRVRRHGVEQARLALAACRTAEMAAVERLRAVDDAARRDREASQTVTEGHLFLDMFARRLEASVAERRAAEAALSAVQAELGAARAMLVEARTAAEGVETLVAEREEATEVDQRRREQHALDDMARPRFDSKER